MKKLIIVIAIVATGAIAFFSLQPKAGQVNVGALTFPVASNLPFADQQLLTQTIAVPSANRTASQSAYLTRRTVYIYNEIIQSDAAGDILVAQGQTLPTGYTGFAKGATFRIVDAADNIRSQYENTGTTTSATWKPIGVQTQVTVLASASLATLATTPVTLVPSCGTGQVAAISSVTGYRNFASGSWGATAGAINVKFSSNAGAPVIASFSRGFESGNASDSRSSPSFEIRYPLTTLAFNRASASQPLVLTTNSNPVVRNHGSTTFSFWTNYYCVTLP